MRDSDTRPMPVEIQRAYLDPINLQGLLESSVYSEQDRRDMLDALMRLLIAKYGDVWIAFGRKEVLVSTRVKEMDVVTAIDLLSYIEEYGGREGVLPLLAQAMQPQWAQWWESFEWDGWNSVLAWRDVAGRVLGGRQFAWLAAQYARSVVDMTIQKNRAFCVSAIETAEAWASVSSKANRQKARSAADSDALYYAALGAGSNAAYYAVKAAASAASTTNVDGATAAAANAAAAANYAATDAGAARPAAYASLTALTRRLITPTLVTRPSHGLRASGSVTSRPASVAVGAALGAGAVFLAKRA